MLLLPLAIGSIPGAPRSLEFGQARKAYIKKGFVLDNNRLKQSEQFFGTDYFQELLERVRYIRASERKMYQKINAARNDGNGISHQNHSKLSP